MARIEYMTLEELREIRQILELETGYSGLGIRYQDTLEIHKGTLRYFSPGYGPWDDERIVITSDPVKVKKFALLLQVNKRIAEIEKERNLEVRKCIEDLLSQIQEEVVE